VIDAVDTGAADRPTPGKFRRPEPDRGSCALGDHAMTRANDRDMIADMSCQIDVERLTESDGTA
jgi:hypothetical protein